MRSYFSRFISIPIYESEKLDSIVNNVVKTYCLNDSLKNKIHEIISKELTKIDEIKNDPYNQISK